MNLTRVPEHVKVLSVSELTSEVKTLMEDAFPSVWVAGEVSNFSRPKSGHLYLTLKDSEAQIKAVIFRGIASRLRFELRDGLEVIVRGRVNVYAPRGDYQLVVEELQPKGIGALELALQQLREKLFGLGYFARERKKPLPRFPRRIALVTSPTGAAIRDMLEILGRRWPAAEVWVCPVRVQGDGAGLEIATALLLLQGLSGIDVIIVGRGGGSAEDLWAFNEECVAHALYRSRIPVVSAVGHEIDVTIADLVADCRALTPSEAAERVAPNCAEILEFLGGLHAKLQALLIQRLERGKRRLTELEQCRVLRLPLERIHDHERRLDDWQLRLDRAIHQRMCRVRERLAAEAGRLESLSPLNVLGRGYSLTRRETDQVVVRHPEQVQAGDLLVTDVQHGRIRSRVQTIEFAASKASSSQPT